MQQITTIGPGAPAPGDERSGDRFGIALAVTMDDGEGETLDISETGILFETAVASQPRLGSTVNLTLDYSVDGNDYRASCEAQVVRLQQVGNRVNVATRLLSPLFSRQ